MRSRAFTLIELLVVISIVALLSSVVAASLNAAREKGRIAAAQQFATGLYHALGSEPGGFWRFDEGSGTVVQDSSGNGWNGTFPGSGVTWSTDTPTGKGYSVSLAGTSFITLPVAGRTDLQDITDPNGIGFTMGCWFKASGLPPVNQGYIVMRPGWHTGIYMSTTGIFGGNLWNAALNNSPNASSAININDGKWHHLAFSANDSTKTMTLYFDGKQVASVTHSQTVYDYGAVQFQIGGNGNYYAYGLVDDVVIIGAPFK